MQATSRYVIFVGGTGSRMATALICAAAAGVYPDETLNVLLADTAHQGLRSAEMVAAQAADVYDNNKYKNPSGIFRADCAKLLQRNKLDIIESCNMQTK